MYATDLREKKYKAVNQLTNILYVLTKMRFTSRQDPDREWVAKSLELLLNEPKLTHVMACRNLWNLYALDYESEDALDRLSQVVMETNEDKLGEIDIAHTLRAFSHFKYRKYACIEHLLKITIKKADMYKVQTLADVIHSLAELEIVNPTLLQITKQVLLRKLDRKAEGPNGEPVIQDSDGTDLMPFEMAMVMKAYCKAGMYEEVELLESLESAFLERIEDATTSDIVVIFGAHSSWCSNMIDQTHTAKNQKKRVFKVFKAYSDEVFAKLMDQMSAQIDKMNVKGILSVLVHGNLSYLKRRDNKRMVRDFAIKGLDILSRERDSMGDNFE